MCPYCQGRIIRQCKYGAVMQQLWWKKTTQMPKEHSACDKNILDGGGSEIELAVQAVQTSY